LSPLTHWLAQRLVKVRWFSLPNLLANEALVPEFLQKEVKAEKLGSVLLEWLENPAKMAPLQKAFERIHHELRQDADNRAATAVMKLLKKTD
jgi:lipid-A-disaccharide synthase